VIELKNTADIKPNQDLLISAIIASMKGDGKTTLASTFPDPLFFDFDGGVNSLMGTSYPYISNPNYETMLEVMLAVQRGGQPCASIGIKLTGEGVSTPVDTEVPVRTIVFDSITKGHRRFLESAMALGRRSIPAIQDWGLASQRLTEMIDGLKPFVNVVICAHFEIIKDANLERVMAQVWLPGQLANLLPLGCDELWRIRTEVAAGNKRKFTLCTVSDGIFPGATRFAQRGMPPFLDITGADGQDGRPKAYDLVRRCIK